MSPTPFEGQATIGRRQIRLLGECLRPNRQGDVACSAGIRLKLEGNRAANLDYAQMAQRQSMSEPQQVFPDAKFALEAHALDDREACDESEPKL
jgi:hypothetical protein